MRLSFLLLAGIAPLITARNLSTLPLPSAGSKTPASLTRYDLPSAAIAACGCSPASSAAGPNAALNQAAFGSTISSGPACGMCVNVTLVSAFIATPPYTLPEAERPSIVVKITDKCPSESWCNSTSTKPNKAGMFYHFDLASPSSSVPLSFFPVPPPSYGYNDFGAWIAEFEVVSCEFWSGFTSVNSSVVDSSLGGDSGCCPLAPGFGNATCPATSLKFGAGIRLDSSHALSLLAVVLSIVIVHG